MQLQEAFDARSHDLEIEQSLWADACYRNFWLFLLYAFGAKFYCQTHPREDWIEPERHKQAVDYVQDTIEREWFGRPPDIDELLCILVLMPRGTAKTTIFTEALPLWLHLHDGEMCSYIDSYTLPMSVSFLAVIQKVMAGTAGNAWFASLYGAWEPINDPARPWNKEACVHTQRNDVERKDPSFECVSVATGTTGHHPDHVAEDDPVVQEKLNEAKSWLKKVDTHQGALIPAMQKNALHVLCMTTYTETDCSVRAMKFERVKEFAPTGCMPNKRFYTLDPKDGKWHVLFMPGRNVNMKSKAHPDGEPMFPKVWSENRMRKYQRDRPLEYSSQVMLDPTEGKHQLITMAACERLFIPHDQVPRDLRISIHFDTAFNYPTRRANGDNSVIIVAGHACDGTGRVYGLECWADNDWDVDDFIKEFCMILQRLWDTGNKPFGLTDETQGGGKAGSFERLLRGEVRRLVRLPLPPYHEIPRQGTKKELRIETAAGYWKTGLVRLDQDGPGIREWVNEMVFYRMVEHDDRCDAGADMFAQEIYKGARRMSKVITQGAPPRPYDDLLKMRSRNWTDAETDYVLDKMEREEAQQRAGNPGDEYERTWN